MARDTFNTDYEAVPVSVTRTLGPIGKKGDILEALVVTVNVADATSAVTIADGDGSAIPVVPPSAPIGVYSIEIGARATSETNQGWKVTTLAGATVLAVGKFK